MSDDTSRHDVTRAELYREAKDRDLPGRSTMSKAELAQALGQLSDGRADEEEPGGPDSAHTQQDLGEQREEEVRVAASRYEAYCELAASRARGESIFLPRMLRGHDRRIHVRQTLREDHRSRIDRHSEEAAAKFEKLAGSLYSFFRGTALLFYRDLAGEDPWMPTVLALGDVHPENFGVMPNANNVPIFGVNDFDEAYYAPFTWDLKRGAVGFMLAAEEEGGAGRKRQRKVVRRFVRGYIDGMERFAREGSEESHQLRIDNSPELIRDLIEDSLEDRAEWLADDYLDEFKRGFRADDELVPVSNRRQEFQDLIERYVQENGITVPERAGQLRVKDVARRLGQGTASLGLTRYYVLIEGPNADGTDDLVLEFKQARRSALSGLVPPSGFGRDGEGGRIAHAQAVQLVRGDVFYGGIEFEGRSYMGRERAPFRDDIDLDDLSKKQWKRYAEICGATLAHAHALSDEVGDVGRDIEPEILASVGDRRLFVDDIVRFADEAADRVRRDHQSFIDDHELGAFDHIDVVYR